MSRIPFLQHLTEWRKAHRFGLQVSALLIGIAAPFALFAALSAGQVILASVIFVLLALGLILTFWAG